MSVKGQLWLPDFKIAFTFTGEYRERIVRPVCEELLKYGYRQDDIFFDEWHPELFTGVNADAIFREIYHDVSQCVVVLLSPNYSDKLWTGNLEWPTVRALINEGTHHKICPLRVDDVDINNIEGLYASRDVARSVDKMTPAQIARFIHRWYCIHVLKQSPDAGKAKTDETAKPAPVPKKEAESEGSGAAGEADAASVPERRKATQPAGTVSKAEAVPELETVDADSATAREAAVSIPKSDPLTWLENGNVLFGSYPQTKKGERQPIEWLVLKREEDRALLISRYVLNAKPYNVTFTDTTWAECSLRGWLNGRGTGDFPQEAFTAEERERILQTPVSADKNPYFSTNPGKPTKDKVFLLSIPEAYELFSSEEARRCAPTDYVKSQGMYTNNDYKADGRPSCWWWLRSPGSNSNSAACVNYGGSVYGSGNYVSFGSVGVRPALWINL